MKTFITLVIGGLLALGIESGVQWCQDPTPPSAEAQVIIDSMNKGEGWRLGKQKNCIVNEKANTTITAGWLAQIEVFDPDKDNKGSKVYHREFGWLDRWHIGRHYDTVRRKLEVNKF